MSNYQVGQILYMTNDKSMKIIPLQVVEEIVRTTLQGKELIHIVMFPDNKKTLVPVNKIKGKVFDSLELTKKHMLENTQNAINKMAAGAKMLESEAFGVKEESLEEQNDQNEHGVQVETNDDIITVDLGNGVKAKMDVSNLQQVSQ